MQLARGKVNGIETGIQLKASSCFDFAGRSLALDYFAIALEWMEVGKQRIKIGDFRGTPKADKLKIMFNDLKYIVSR